MFSVSPKLLSVKKQELIVNFQKIVIPALVHTVPVVVLSYRNTTHTDSGNGTGPKMS